MHIVNEHINSCCWNLIGEALDCLHVTQKFKDGLSLKIKIFASNKPLSKFLCAHCFLSNKIKAH